MTAGGMAAHKQPLITRWRLLARVKRTNDLHVIHKQSAALVRVDILPRIFEIGKFRIRCSEESFSCLYRRSSDKLASFVSKSRGSLNNCADDWSSVNRKNQFPRRRSIASSLFPRFQFFRCRFNNNTCGALRSP